MLPLADDPCRHIHGPARKWCNKENEAPDGGGGGDDGGGLVGGASDHVNDLAISLIKALRNLVAPGKTWAPKSPDNAVYSQFMWLGQHLAIAVFICVVVVCALTAWQGLPRLKQMGASTGSTLVAVAGMASVPGVVYALNKSVSQGFTVAFDSNEATVFGVIRKDLDEGGGNPLASLIIIAFLVVALAFAALVFLCRNLGILVFVCFAPIVLASLARGGDTKALRDWMQRLLGLMFAPFMLLIAAPFTGYTKGSLVMDLVLLVAVDVAMLRMIYSGVPYFGPRIAGAARSFVESRLPHPAVRRVMSAGAPAFAEQENTPRHPRTLPTPARAMGQSGHVLMGSFGLKTRERPGRLTTESAIAQTRRDAERSTRIMDARRAARNAHRNRGGGGNQGAPDEQQPNP